jgi:hypothetical protein
MQVILSNFLGAALCTASFTRLYPLFAGKRPIFPEKRVNTSQGDGTLAFGRANQRPARESNMTQETTSNGNIRGTIGTALFLIGSTILVGYSAALAWQFQAALNATVVDSLGCFGNLALASVRAVRIVMLDHTVLLSVLHSILVLCSALIGTLIGIALLPKRGVSATLSGSSRVPARVKGDQ